MLVSVVSVFGGFPFWRALRVKLLGDVNCDGIVNTQDSASVGKTFGAKVGNSLYDPNADFNSDGVIDIADLAIIGKNYGKTYP